jgi:hypothetical protein
MFIPVPAPTTYLATNSNDGFAAAGNAQVTRQSMPVSSSRFGSIAFSPTFFIRYEGSGSVHEIQLKASDLAADHWDGLDAFFWRSFSLSAYDQLRNGFRLRWWRRPRWIMEQITSNDGHLREEKFVTILRGAIDGDIFWLEAGAARARGTVVVA